MVKYFLVILFILLTILSHTQIKPDRDISQEFPIEILNYNSEESIEKFKKLELGIILSDELQQRILGFVEPEIYPHNQPINPFLDWELDIDVAFEHPASGFAKSRDFFFFKDFTRDTIHDDWNDEINFDNKFIMRARFAPPKAGLWTTKVTVKVKNELITEFNSISFVVNENSHPGYVTLHENNRNFERGGKIIYPLSQVFPGPYNGVKIWSSSMYNTNKAASVNAWMNFHQDVSDYIEKGGKYIKTCETIYGNLLEFEHKGNYYNRMHYAWEEDKLLEKCEENDVLIYFNLMFQDPLVSYGGSGMYEEGNTAKGCAPYPWDYGNFDLDGKKNRNDKYPTYGYFVEGEKPSNMLLDEELMKFHKQRTRYYIARYGYSPQIYMYELLSEPWHLNQIKDDMPIEKIGTGEKDTVFMALENYHNEISDYIKDELNQKEQLISVCEYIIGYKLDTNLITSSAKNKNIDVVGINLYGDEENKFLAFKRGENTFGVDSDEVSLYKVSKWIEDKFNKPLILSESGHYRNNCNDFIGQDIDIVTTPFSGVAAVVIWHGYNSRDHMGFDTRVVWPSTIIGSNFLNSEIVTNTLSNNEGDWKQGRQEAKINNKDKKYSKELQYYLSQDESLAVGYVKNRTYNIHTMRNDEECFRYTSEQYPIDELTDIKWQKGNDDLEIIGLNDKEKYTITWYEYLSSEVLEIDEVKSNRKGVLKLKYPYLEVTTEKKSPIYWFSLEKMKTE